MGYVQKEQEGYYGHGPIPAAYAEANARSAFITRTYLHLAGAIAAFAGLEAVLLNLPGIEPFLGSMMGGYNWLIVLGLFMVVNMVAERWAMNATSLATQYAGLGIYVVAEAVIFLPILYIASRFYPDAIPTAAVATLILFGGLTASVFLTRTDFSFMRSFLRFAGFAAMAFIICGIVFNFTLGLVFTVAMIALMAGFILYETSNVMLHYPVNRHVAASLALFASLATLFWYVLRLIIALQSRRD